MDKIYIIVGIITEYGTNEITSYEELGYFTNISRAIDAIVNNENDLHDDLYSYVALVTRPVNTVMLFPDEPVKIYQFTGEKYTLIDEPEIAKYF